MKKIWVFFVAFTFFLLACGILPAPDANPTPFVNPTSVVSPTPELSPVPIETSDPSQSIEASVGSDFTIVLDSNPTTGYHWEFVSEPDANILQFVSKDYKPDEPISVGSGGVDVLTFHALAAGTAQITLGYYPPSNDPVEPQQSVTFDVIVK